MYLQECFQFKDLKQLVDPLLSWYANYKSNNVQWRQVGNLKTQQKSLISLS